MAPGSRGGGDAVGGEFEDIGVEFGGEFRGVVLHGVVGMGRSLQSSEGGGVEEAMVRRGRSGTWTKLSKAILWSLSACRRAVWS